MSGFNDDRCFISFYRVENFIAEIDTYQDHQIYRKRRSDHSLKAKGNCCWVLFSKSNFRGRMTFIGQNERRKRLKRGLGRRHGKRFRSMKKIENCKDSLKIKTLEQRKRQNRNRYRINWLINSYLLIVCFICIESILKEWNKSRITIVQCTLLHFYAIRPKTFDTSQRHQ